MMDKESQENQVDLSTVQAHGEADLAGEFLSRALRHSFFILKIIMAVLVVLFITSGIFSVEENENALVLQLGRIREFRSREGDKYRVLKPGLHWAWPEPISEIVRIPVTRVQALTVNSFWYFETEQERLKTTPTEYSGGPTLDPRKDGYCLTRNETSEGAGGSDYSIVHARCNLTYRIDDIEMFFHNVYYETPSPGQDFLDVVSKTVDPLLQALVADAVTATMVNYTIDEAILNDPRIVREVEKRLKTKLDEIDSGIAIDTFQMPRITWPRQVNREFNDSVGAQNRRDQVIAEARSYRDQILSEAGGAQAEAVLGELKTIYEAMKNGGLADAQKQQYEQQRESLLSQLAGTAQERLAEARAYRTDVVERARADAEYLTKLLPEFQRYPALVVQQIYEQAVEEVFSNADEKFLVQLGKNKEFRVLINSDPALQKRRVEDAQKQSENQQAK